MGLDITNFIDWAEQSDQQLAAQVGQGNREAFAALYQRYFEKIFDFTARITRDRDEAADIVQGTFVKAWQQLQEGKQPKNIKAWLYTVARNAAIDELRRRERLLFHDGREAEERQIHNLAMIDTNKLSNPQAALAEKELAELVWHAAAALNPKDYALLDLHLRQGLSRDELAESLGLSKGAIYTKLSRLKNALEESVVSALLLGPGRRNCPELDTLLTELQATELTRKVRWTIQSHLGECPNCQESKRRYASACSILGAFIPVPPPHGLRDLTWLRISEQITSGGTATPSHQSRSHSFFRIGTAKWLIPTTLMTLFATGIALFLAFPVRDPFDVHSTSHQVGQPSEDDIVVMAWSGLLNAMAYSVLWSQDAPALPDAIADPEVNTTGVASPPLSQGSWYFNLRTEGWNGRWTSTLHVGPFIILQATPPSPPLPSESPTPTTTPPSISALPPTPTLTSTLANTPTPPPTEVPNSSPQVPPSNNPPVANDDTASTTEDTPVTIPVLTNDDDPDSDPITITRIGDAANGTIADNGGGTIIYTPDPGFTDSDTFTYTISDGDGGSDTATVAITVHPVIDRPLVNDDFYSIPENTTLIVLVPGVITNDTIPDGDTLSVLPYDDVSANGGLVLMSSNGSFSYNPPTNFCGIDTFEYTIADGSLSTDTATVSIDVTCINESPLAVDDTDTTPEDTPVIVTVLNNDSDPDGDTVSVASTKQPANGTVAINPDDTVTYTPDSNFNGSDSFSYTLSDGNGHTGTAAVFINVIPVNDPPMANDDSATTFEANPVTIEVLANDEDLDNDLDITTIFILRAPKTGGVALDIPGQIIYIPKTSGDDTFVYGLCDDDGACDTATVTITVKPLPPDKK